MKAIVSHDIDHLTHSEHFLKDLIVPKCIVRSYIELFSGKISVSELLNRIADLGKNKWQHIDELMAFNKAHNIPATFFIGVNQGLGLSYTLEQATYWIKRIQASGYEVGLHGIEYESYEKINEEYSRFEKASGSQAFGTRMHYIRKNETTFDNMARCGFKFDSSEMGYRAPYKIGNMWEFPFQIMDGYIIEKPKQWQSKNFHQSCEETKQIIEKAYEHNLPYLGIDFHDRYFSNAHKTWKNWYVWLIEYLTAQGITCINFTQAIKELEQQKEYATL